MLNITEIVAQNSKTVVNLPPTSEPFIKLTKCLDEIPVNADDHLQSTCTQPFEATKVFRYAVVEHEIAASGEDIKTVYDLTLETESTIDYRFNPGDTIGILTKNFDHDVDTVMTRLELRDVQSYYRIEIDSSTKKKKAAIPPYIPSLVQPRKLFSECLDLRAIPKKLFINALIPYTSDEKEKRFLSLLANRHETAFDDIVLRPSLKFISLLSCIESCKPTIELLIEHLPRLMPRPYSIANSFDNSVQSTKIRLIFSLRDQNPGLTTALLEKCSNTDSAVFLYFRKTSSFHFTDDDLGRDIVMIGVGTGIAPYMGFLERREQAIDQGDKSLGEAWLFAGFRYELLSYLCRKEIEHYLKKTALTKLSVAFSRDPNSRFRYVQDQIEANKEDLVRILSSSNGRLFVCGDGKSMLPEVTAKIGQIMSVVLGISQEESAKLIADKKESGSYVEDIWL
ncbi:methionine synthase reductase-like [Wyeomyia smithii]|uniref:methionine synthase reductase-like n=1 Tax=Wyeomyia smithii TaxID=174621 RepID=UPI00246808F6|nr:methionine synthase reductase-like [Wyeomyia smithii]